MRAAIDLQAVADRVLGVVPPRPGLRTLRRRRGDMVLALAMLAASGLAVFGSLALWIAGHGLLGARVFCGSVLLLALLLRLR